MSARSICRVASCQDSRHFGAGSYNLLQHALALAQRDASVLRLVYDDAQDYVTSFEVLVWRAIVSGAAPPFEEEWRHKPWLRRCLYHHKIAFVIADERRREHEAAWPAETPEPSLSDFSRMLTSPTPEEALCRKEQAVHLHEAISHLRPSPRRLVIAYYFEGKSLQELAESLGRTPHAMAQSLHDARVRLRKWLEEADAH